VFRLLAHDAISSQVVATFYTILLIAAFLAIVGLAALAITKLFAGQR
jgi:hypothetical protein